MALKYFLVYIGVFLGGAVTLLMLAKSFAPGIAVNAKKPVLQGGLAAVITSGITYLTTLFTNHLFSVFWIFAGVFLLFGIVHMWLFHRKYFLPDETRAAKVTTGEIMFMLGLLFFVIVFFSSLMYFLKDKNFLFFPMAMSMLAFFIPLSVYHTFNAAFNIPESRFPVWEYPLNNPIDLPEEVPNEKILVVAFVVAKNATDKTMNNFRAKGPETMRLGDFFYHFINDYNEVQSETPIRYTENEYAPYTWAFRIRPRWYQRHRILNPEFTLRENNIRENSIIICERI